MTTILSKDVCDAIDHWVQKFPDGKQKSALLPALMVAQEANKNYLSKELIEAVADYLKIPVSSAMEVASFYDMYNLKPVGKHKIDICTNISCMLNGCQGIVEAFEKRCGVKLGETSEDGKFTLKAVECLGACVGAPMCQIGNEYHENLTPEKVNALIGAMEAKHD